MKTTKILLAAMAVSLLSLTIKAQDMIHKTDETVISAKIIEVNSSTIKYKPFDNATERVFELSKNEIYYIVYQNGTKEYYNTNTSTTNNTYVETTETKPMKVENKKILKNIIALDCFDMIFTNLSFSFERVLNSGKISLKIPVSIGLQGKPNTTNYTSELGQTQFLQNRNVAAGLDLNIYPFGQTKNTFFVGLSTFAGTFNYYKDIATATYNGYNGYYTTVTGHTKYEGMHYSGMVHLGGYLHMGDNFLIGCKIGVGFKREETIEPDNYTLPTAQFDFNLGYRF